MLPRSTPGSGADGVGVHPRPLLDRSRDVADVILDDVVANFLGRIVWLVLPIFVILLAIDVLLMRRLLRPMLLWKQPMPVWN